jgi:hypothetical protein
MTMPDWIALTLIVLAGWCAISVLFAFALAHLFGRLDDRVLFEEDDAVLPLTRATTDEQLERQPERASVA